MKPKIILVHGFASSKREWQFQISFFEKMGYEVLATDLLGHGDGTKPAQAAKYTMDAMYLDFAEWLSSLVASDPIILIGHSMGAAIALRFAIENPEKVEKMILLSPLIAKNQITSVPPLLFRTPKFGSILLRMLPDWLVFLGVSMDKINTRGLDVDMIRQVARDFKRADPRISYFGPSLVDLPQNTVHFSTPALMIWGDRDNTLNPRFFTEFSAGHPHLLVHCVKNGGHAIHQTHKEEVNAAIEKFLLE
jgi:pimeloyl-ACP methyl ester carboxylesterase